MIREKINEIFENTQFLNSQNAVFIAQIYQNYLSNKSSVDPDWVEFFDNLSDIERKSFEADFFGPSWKKRDISVIEKGSKNEVPMSKSSVQGFDVENIILKYGHLEADINPVFGKRQKSSEIEKIISPQNSDLIASLREIYCKSVGLELSHILNKEERDWLQNEYKKTIKSSFSTAEKVEIAKDLYKAQNFEEFLHKKYPGMKRFSLQGGESALASINEIVRSAMGFDYSNVIIGMSHRGRLNVLAHTAKKPFEMIFSEFSKTLKPDESLGEVSWDVKYHAGYKSSWEQGGKKIDVQVAYNPSHLEAVNPVVMGMVYAENKVGRKSLPILLHGDAAFIGQGVVAECFSISGVKNYNAGGVIHIVVNNQVGFTAESAEVRTSRYCTDIAKITECPVFHINGDDADACVKIAQIAIKYREKFKKDIVFDIVCSRKYGHNEGDEPLYTNPIMYNILKTKKTVFEIYKEKNSDINWEEFTKFEAEYLAVLDSAYEKGKEGWKLKRDRSNESKFSDKFSFEVVKTGLKSQKEVHDLISKVHEIPQNFIVNPRLEKQIKDKVATAIDGDIFDWSCGEILAFSSLVRDGHSVRLTGQDSERGTFSHRHSILSDAQNGKKYNIVSPFFSEKANYEVCNSPLSEFAVLGFEHGYSLVNQDHLTIWEAQFGDFSNGASTIFDQFISSCEKKWLQLSNLVMLLPHGFEGQGPEHSSARLEGYLQACAQDNLIVANCTTPANLFHILRRQIFAKYRKPLVIMSPKSLLRHEKVISKAIDFTDKAGFLSIIDEVRNIDKKAVKKLVITSGKLYYDLLERLEIEKIKDVAVIRIEQYYPFDSSLFEVKISQYKSIKSIVWSQEEPKNMGAWSFIRDFIEESCIKVGIKHRLECVSRSASASPATGFEKVHRAEQEAVITKTLLG